MKVKDIPEFTIATYNVLYWPRFKIAKMLMDPDERYTYQVNTIFPNIKPDILCLQEWTIEYLKYLKFCRFSEDYQISSYDTDRAKRHFPMILSLHPFIELINRDRVSLHYNNYRRYMHYSK